MSVPRFNCDPRHFQPLLWESVSSLFVILIMGIGVGCRDTKTVSLGTNWLPTNSVGGPIEIRRLPPASTLRSNYTQWRVASPGPRVRLYEADLLSRDRQVEYTYRVEHSNSPLGRGATTYAAFKYMCPTGGVYRVVLNEVGAVPEQCVRLDSRARRFLFIVLDAQSDIPILQIIAIEGLELDNLLVATE